MELLLPHFEKLTEQNVRDLTEASITNYEVWSAAECAQTYLFIALNETRIDPARLSVLRYQLENQRAFEE